MINDMLDAHWKMTIKTIVWFGVLCVVFGSLLTTLIYLICTL